MVKVPSIETTLAFGLGRIIRGGLFAIALSFSFALFVSPLTLSCCIRYAHGRVARFA